VDPEELLQGVEATDGLRVVEVNLGQGANVSLHFAFRQGGELVSPNLLDTGENRDSVEFWERRNLGPRQMGEKTRVRELAEAVCRFLNTGGQLQELQGISSLLGLLLQGNWSLSIPGYYLLETHVNEDGDYEHLFAPESGIKGIRWVEGSFIEPVDLTDVLNELRAEEGKEITLGVDKVEALPAEGARPSQVSEGEPSP